MMKTISEISREHGIHRKVAYSWAKRMFPNRFNGKVYLNSGEVERLVNLWAKYNATKRSKFKRFENFMAAEGY